MTRVKYEPGPCGFNAVVTAETTEDEDVRITIDTACPHVRKMMETLGDTFEPMTTCMCRPGTDVFHEYAAENYPIHSGCPSIIAILKCMEAEAGLALKADVTVAFVD